MARNIDAFLFPYLDTCMGACTWRFVPVSIHPSRILSSYCFVFLLFLCLHCLRDLRIFCVLYTILSTALFIMCRAVLAKWSLEGMSLGRADKLGVFYGFCVYTNGVTRGGVCALGCVCFAPRAKTCCERG